MKLRHLLLPLVATACVSAPTSGTDGDDATLASGGSLAAGGNPTAGGSPGAGGLVSVGGSPESGGTQSSGGASAGSGGAQTGSGGSPSGTGGATGGFTLLFRDDFNSFDSSRWQLMTHSWDGNLAQFSASTVTTSGGFMTLKLLPAPSGTVVNGETKTFLGAEVRSTATLTYGRVRTRAKLASGSAAVSALVTIYTPWPADNWNELDTECLGADPSKVQFNAMVYTGPLPAPSTPVAPTMDPTIYNLGFNSSSDFHVYEMRWTPTAATFYVDDVLARTWNANISLMNLPQNVLLTIWVSNIVSWAGPVNGNTGNANVVYDWVELYEYNGN